MKQVFAEKLGIEYRPYVILGACNPSLAYEALEANVGAGLLLPCNVVIEERDSGVFASAVDPVALLASAGNTSLHHLALDASARLSNAIAAMAKP